MSKSFEFDQFKKRRMRLTKIWFGLLLFNFFLHMDGVEAFLNGGEQNQPRFVAAEMECSSFGRLQSPSSNQTWQNQWLLSFGLTSHPFDLLADLTGALEFYENKADYFEYSLGIPIWKTQYDPLLSSGLSPPLGS